MTIQFPSPRDLAQGSAIAEELQHDPVHAVFDVELDSDSDLAAVTHSLTAAHETLQRRLADLSR